MSSPLNSENDFEDGGGSRQGRGLGEERAFLLTLRAYDMGSPPLHSEVTVAVFVTDRNDHAPVFERDMYFVQVEEDAPPGTQVARVSTNCEKKNRERIFPFFRLFFPLLLQTAAAAAAVQSKFPPFFFLCRCSPCKKGGAGFANEVHELKQLVSRLVGNKARRFFAHFSIKTWVNVFALWLASAVTLALLRETRAA